MSTYAPFDRGDTFCDSHRLRYTETRVNQINPADVFARHHRAIYRYMLKMTGKRELAEDLTQDVYLRVVRLRDNGCPIGNERAWMFTIARNLLTDHYRRRSRDMTVENHAAEPAKEAGQTLIYGLNQALARLAEADREMFVLKELGGLSYQEIGRVCDCTVEAVRSRLHRTRLALRAELSL